jgi:antitoxin component YwqK of YwqJK toxin-antitoxin module
MYYNLHSVFKSSIIALMKLVPIFLLVLFLCPDVDLLKGDSASSLTTPHRRQGKILKTQHYNKTAPSNNDIVQSEIDLEDTNISDDTFRVNKSEFDQFFTLKFGLLYQKLSSEPFSGRIILIDESSTQKYVYSDESWLGGRKDGTSAKWFSNGIKMYERNYKDGKWHGTVTRWWPNGQKMYVTAYSDGVKTKKEAKWMSDGTQFNSDMSFEKTADDSTDLKSAESSSVEVVEEVNKPVTSLEVTAPEDKALTSPANPSEDSIAPIIPVENENIEKTISDQSTELVLPTLEKSEEVQFDSQEMQQDSTNVTDSNLKLTEETAVQDQATLPVVSDESTDLPTLPDSPDTNDGDNLPPLPDFSSPQKSDSVPSLPSQDAALPDLPDLPTPEVDTPTGGLPPLPTPVGDAPSNDLPGLPTPEVNGASEGLPPLPNPEGGVLSDDLPPLPPLP